MRTLKIHHSRGIDYIHNVDEDRYSYLDLADDAMNAAKVDLGNAFTIKYRAPGSQDLHVIDGDTILMKVFELYSNVNEINLVVEEEPAVLISQCTQEEAATSGGRRSEEQESIDGEDWVDEEVIISEDADEDEDELSNEGEEEGEEVLNDTRVPREHDEVGFEYDEDNGNQLSDYESDLDYQSLANSDEEHVGDESFEFDMDHGMEEPKLEKGMLFPSINDFRKALTEFAIREGFNIKRMKNERTWVTVGCAHDGCRWRLHASLRHDGMTFMIKTIQPEHNCTRVHKNIEANSRWISDKIIPQLRANPKLPISSIREIVHSQYGIEASDMQLRRARRKAIEDIEGTHGQVYGMLWRYSEVVRTTNPGSLVKLEVERFGPSSNPRFKRYFITFNAMKIGFIQGCRPFIGLDGCHLKGPFGGVLLAAVGLDGNGSLFPLAVAVVEAETQYSWSFFLQHLYMMLGSVDQPRTFMTDRQKGIIKAIGDIFPYATQRYCARHVYNNFKTVHKGVLLKNLFWTAARAYHVFDFEDAMERIKDASPEAYDWLKEIPPSTWSRHAFDVRVKNDHITNNLTESFNHWVGEHREKSIISLVDGIRSRWMVKIQKRYQTALTWTTLVTPKVCGILDARIRASRNCRVLFAGQDEYEVKEDETSRYIVKLGPRTCACKVWDLSGIPCKHAVQCIRWRRENLENFCDQSYRVDTYLRAYVEMIHPIPDQKMWPTFEVEPLMPPSLRCLTGRPKKNRRREADEPRTTSEVRRSSTLWCCICKQFGHNKRTCQRGPTRGSNKASGSRREGSSSHALQEEHQRGNTSSNR